MRDDADITGALDELQRARARLEKHLERHASWLALKQAEARLRGGRRPRSGARGQGKRKLHRSLLAETQVYRSYTRLIEAIRALEAAQGTVPGARQTKADARTKHSRNAEQPPAAAARHEAGSTSGSVKPRVKVKAHSVVVPPAPAGDASPSLDARGSNLPAEAMPGWPETYEPVDLQGDGYELGGVEEAEVTIVHTSRHAGAESPTMSVATAPVPLSIRLKQFAREADVAGESHAAYHDDIEEAEVEIIHGSAGRAAGTDADTPDPDGPTGKR